MPPAPTDAAARPVRAAPVAGFAVEPFHAIEISRAARRLEGRGRRVIHMEFGQPSTGAPAPAVEAARRVLGEDALGYWESAHLLERLSRHYREWYGVDAPAERILLTSGASAALVAALSTDFEAGARIAFARPGYVAYRNVVRALRLEPVEIPCGPEDRFQLTARALEALDPAPAAVILASPANPTGALIAPSELKAIAEICRARGVRCVSDEIYHGLSYLEPARSMLEFSPDVFVLGSFSKYYSMPGWRLGWIVAPEDRVDRARACVGNLFLTPPSLSQHAALAAMDCGPELEARKAVYRENRSRILAALPRLGLSRVAPPDGAFYIYADVSHLTDDSLGFCRRLLDATGVATAPGIDFDPVEGRRFVRFSFAVSTDEIEEALARLEPALRPGALPA